MIVKVVTSSVRYRIRFYIPMLVAVALSLSLIGASGIIGDSFDEIVSREMKKYGANVILKSPNEKDVAIVDEHVSVYVKQAKIGDFEVDLAITDVKKLLELNPAWIVRGNGEVIVGKELAKLFGIEEGDTIEIDGFKGAVAILDSGTEFDSFVIINGTVKEKTMILIRTEEPEKYRGKNAVILEEMVKTKYSFLKSIEKFLLYISAISAIASFVAIVNFARIDAGKRRKEFGVLKAIGADMKTISKLIFAEFGILSVIAALISLFLSITLSWIILISTTNTSPTFGFKSLIYTSSLSIVAFYAVSLIYLLESRKQEVINELRGE